MKNRILNASMITLLLISMISCDESTKVIGGDQAEYSVEGTSFTSYNLPGILQGGTAEITSLENGVSVLTVTADFTDEEIEEIQQLVPSYDGELTYDAEFRITEEGVQSVYEDGTSFTLVKYDAKVGDKYTLKRNGQNLVREVVQKSTEDDFLWNGLLLKTVSVKETGRAVPGFQEANMVFNHRFGLVYYEMKFEDGSSKSFPVKFQ